MYIIQHVNISKYELGYRAWGERWGAGEPARALRRPERAQLAPSRRSGRPDRAKIALGGLRSRLERAKIAPSGARSRLERAKIVLGQRLWSIWGIRRVDLGNF